MQLPFEFSIYVTVISFVNTDFSAVLYLFILVAKWSKSNKSKKRLEYGFCTCTAFVVNDGIFPFGFSMALWIPHLLRRFNIKQSFHLNWFVYKTNEFKMHVISHLFLKCLWLSHVLCMRDVRVICILYAYQINKLSKKKFFKSNLKKNFVLQYKCEELLWPSHSLLFMGIQDRHINVNYGYLNRVMLLYIPLLHSLWRVLSVFRCQ